MPKEITVKSILNKTKQRDSWFLDDYTINLYNSCSFNCLYCYIRGSKYGSNLEQSLSVKTNAIEIGTLSPYTGATHIKPKKPNMLMTLAASANLNVIPNAKTQKKAYKMVPS